MDQQIDDLLNLWGRRAPRPGLIVVQWAEGLARCSDASVEIQDLCEDDEHGLPVDAVAMFRVERHAGVLDEFASGALLNIDLIPRGLGRPDSTGFWLSEVIHDGAPLPCGVIPMGFLEGADNRDVVVIDGWLDRDLQLRRPEPDRAVLRRPVPAPGGIDVGLRLFQFVLICLCPLAVLFAARPFQLEARQELAEGDQPVGPPTPGTPPLVGLCTATDATFLAILRCEVKAQAETGQVSPTCDPALAALSGGVDLQPDMCGIVDTALDRTALDRKADDPPSVNLADVVLSQACFLTLGEPGAYSDLDPGGVRTSRADPERMLRGEDAIDGLVASRAEIGAACLERRSAMTALLRGGVAATHVSSRAPDLRAEVGSMIEAQMPADDLRCAFRRGLVHGIDAAGYRDLDCVHAPDPEPPVSGPAQQNTLFSELGGDVSSEPGALVRRYARARWKDGIPAVAKGADPDAGLWTCQHDLARERGPTTGVGAWGLVVPVPHREDVTGRGGVASQLLLESALVGVRQGGADLGSCWPELTGMLSSWVPAAPLLRPIDPKAWLSPGQQVCDQACAVAFGFGAVEARPAGLDADIDACVDGRATPSDRAGGPLLLLPWNGEGPDGTSRRREATNPQVCAFNLIASGMLDFGRKDWIPGDVSDSVWAGEAAPGVAGGREGAAYEAALQLAKLGPADRTGAPQCGAVALQCFAGLALEQRSPGDATQWGRRWEDAVQELANDRVLEVGKREPWCALIYPYLRPQSPTETLDATCQVGVEQAREGVRTILRKATVGGTP